MMDDILFVWVLAAIRLENLLVCQNENSKDSAVFYCERNMEVTMIKTCEDLNQINDFLRYHRLFLNVSKFNVELIQLYLPLKSMILLLKLFNPYVVVISV